MKKHALLLLSLLLALLFVLPAAAAGDGTRLLDWDHLLTDEQALSLSAMLDEISVRQGFDVVIMTTDVITKSPMEDADDTFDYGGYGVGADRSGILLLVCLNTRDFWVSTRGFGITAFTDYGLVQMENSYVPYLRAGDYYTAFTTFASLCDSYLTEAKNGTPIDSYTGYETVERSAPAPYFSVGRIIGALIVAFLIALIAASAEKGKLTSIYKNDTAFNYEKPGSLRVTTARDIFLYRNVSKVRIERSTSSGGGGSTTHHSSSGASHGGHGGKF